VAAVILAASGVVAADPDMAGAAPVPMVNDRDCPSTAPIKTQVDNDIFCKTIPEFCAAIPFSDTFSLRTRAGRAIEIPTSLSKRGYRLSIFVDGVQMLVIPATR
jgi:hypothetical protein